MCRTVRKDSGFAGEDAYVIITRGNLQMMAVADGVASWGLQGIDAGQYSRCVCERERERERE
jgi:hypothetical protein